MMPALIACDPAFKKRDFFSRIDVFDHGLHGLFC